MRSLTASSLPQMPEENAIFSLPYELTQKYGIRRYGEHGISHEYLAQKTAELLENHWLTSN